MTNDFKQNLLNYFVGNMPRETGTTDEIIKKVESIDTTVYQNFIPEYTKLRIEGLIKDRISDNVVLYGGYIDSENVVKGILMIMTADLQPLKTYYQFDSGTYMRYVQALNQADDGTFYLIDCPDYPNDKPQSIITSEKRFIMVNNFVQSKKLILRRSYSFPTDYKNFYAYKIFKDVNSANYCFVGKIFTENTITGVFNYREIRVITLKIEVGQANEWNKYDSDGSGWLLGDCYVEYDENNSLFYQLIITKLDLNDKNVYLWTKNFNSSSLEIKIIANFEFSAYIDTQSYNNQSIFINKNEIYFVLNNQHWGISGKNEKKYIGLYYYNNSTLELKKFFEKYLGDYDYCDLEAIYVNTNLNELYIQYNTNITQSPYKADYYFQRYVDKWNPIEIGLQQNFVRNYRLFYVNNTFNKINAYMYNTTFTANFWQLYNILEVYNSNNYNGEPYKNINSMIPNSGILYDDNNDVIFARNLYNKIVNDRVTQATIEIPNNYLNDKMIAKQDLISETNSIMVEKENIITKNVYETVYLNFINTLQMINNNDTNNPILNPVGATRLNESISEVQDYDNQKISKAKINYQDGTNSIIPIAFTQVENTMRTNFTIYVNKGIINIELLSQDEDTVYNTITSEFELNKTYTISQDLTVSGVQL